jgi:hypothetical protein
VKIRYLRMRVTGLGWETMPEEGYQREGRGSEIGYLTRRWLTGPGEIGY